LINGAGGAAGSFAVQLAKRDGAEVTAVDHGDKGDFLRSLGADRVIDYATTDFTRMPDQYDLVLDTIGRRSVIACAKALRPNGVYFFVGGAIRVLFAVLAFGPLIRRISGKTVRLLGVPQDRPTLLAVTELCAERMIVPAIDRTYALGDAREALRYVTEGRQKGKVVITFEAQDAPLAHGDRLAT